MSDIKNNFKGKNVRLYVTDEMSVVNVKSKELPGYLFVYEGNPNGIYAYGEHIASGYGFAKPELIDNAAYLASAYNEIFGDLEERATLAAENNFVDRFNQVCDELKDIIKTGDEASVNLSYSYINTKTYELGTVVDKTFNTLSKEFTSELDKTCKFKGYDLSTEPEDSKFGYIYTDTSYITNIYTEDEKYEPIGAISNILHRRENKVSIDEFILANTDHYKCVLPKLNATITVIYNNKRIQNKGVIYYEPNGKIEFQLTVSVTINKNDFSTFDAPNVTINLPSESRIIQYDIKEFTDKQIVYRLRKETITIDNVKVNMEDIDFVKNVYVDYSNVDENKLLIPEFKKVGINYTDENPINTENGRIDISDNFDIKLKPIVPVYYQFSNEYNETQFPKPTKTNTYGATQIYVQDDILETSLNINANELNTFKIAIPTGFQISNLMCTIYGITQYLEDVVEKYSINESIDTDFKFNGKPYSILIFNFEHGYTLPADSVISFIIKKIDTTTTNDAEDTNPYVKNHNLTNSNADNYVMDDSTVTITIDKLQQHEADSDYSFEL